MRISDWSSDVCSSDLTGGSAVGGATDEGVTANSIKVGHIGIYSGPVGSFGDDLSYAGRAKLQEINDTGGINGRKLDVLVRDDAWDRIGRAARRERGCLYG